MKDRDANTGDRLQGQEQISPSLGTLYFTFIVATEQPTNDYRQTNKLSQ